MRARESIRSGTVGLFFLTVGLHLTLSPNWITWLCDGSIFWIYIICFREEFSSGTQKCFWTLGNSRHWCSYRLSLWLLFPSIAASHDENLNVETHCRTFQLILPLALATWLLSLGYPKTDFFLRGDRKRQIQDRRFSWDLYCDPSFLPWCRMMLRMVIVNLWPWDNKSEGQGHHDKVYQKDKQKSFELVWYHRLWITVMRPCVCWFLVKPVYITQLLQWTPMPSNSSFVLWQGDDVR